jgi:hypothetical protein
MTLKDIGSSIWNFVSQKAGPALFQMTPAGQFVKQAQNYLQMVGATAPPQITNKILSYEKPVMDVRNFMANPPQANLVQYAEPIQNPYLRFGATLPLGVAQTFINTPSNYLKGITQTGLNVGALNRGEQVSPQKLLGGAAPTAESILNIATLGVGNTAIKQLGKQTLKSAVKQGLIQGGKYGGTYGTLTGLQQYQDLPDPKEWIKSVGLSTLAGGATGAVLGGIAGAAGYGINKALTRERPEKLKTYGDSMERLRALLRPEEAEQQLLARGYTPKQIKTISVPKYLEIIRNDIPPSRYFATQKAQVPLTREGEVFSRSFKEWIGERQSALTSAIEDNKKYSTIPKGLSSDIIRYIENPSTNVTPQVKEYAKLIRQDYNRMFNEARSTGIDIDYYQNYITHIWKESPSKVSQIFKSARKNFKFAKDRTIPTYEEGIELGLHPKYDHVAQIMAEYTRRLGELKANASFLSKLKDAGLIVTAQVGGRDPSYSPILAVGFPKTSTIIRGQKMFVPYYAPTEIADVINRVFAIQESPLTRVAKVSGGLQDVVMSGGIPKTPANAWSFAQMTKEFSAGRIIDPIKAFFRSFSGKASNEFFQENAEQIRKMQLRNIPISSTNNIENMISKGAVKDAFGENFLQAWNKTVNEPTFKRFMPQLEIELFNSIEKIALKKGIAEKEAADVAALAVKKFYGVKGSDLLTLESSFSKDFKSAFFFAPRYRESMINFWVETVKALKNPLAIENQNNVRFLVGTALTYYAYNSLNRQINGRSMNDNPPGTEDKLLIPLKDGTTLGIPFLSSIATIPRLIYRAGKRAIEGDIEGTIREGRGTLSTLLRPLSDVVFNENYYGQQIYDPQDSRGTKLRKIGLHLAGSYNHPYIRALMDYVNKGEPEYQSLSKAFELPFRFYKTDSLDGKYYFEQKDNVLKGLSAQEMIIYDKLHEGKMTDEDGLPIYNTRSEMANALDRLANPKVLQAEALIALQTAEKTGEKVNPFYLLTPKQQETVLILKTFYPGDSTKSQITNANIEWLKPYWNQRDEYVADLKSKGIIKDTTYQFGKPVVDEVLRQKLDFYFLLPSGTGQRSAYLRQNPDVLTYFNENRQYTNTQRADLGLPLLAEYSNYSARPNIKIKLASVRKPKTIKIATKKLKSYKIKALPKAKLLKIKKVPKIKIFKIKKLSKLI